jgi:hypothetical protein
MLGMAGLYHRKHNWIEPDGVLARDSFPPRPQMTLGKLDKPESKELVPLKFRKPPNYAKRFRIILVFCLTPLPGSLARTRQQALPLITCDTNLDRKRLHE